MHDHVRLIHVLPFIASLLFGSEARSRGAEQPASTLDEGQKILVDLVLERRAETVWGALDDLERRVLDELGLEQGRIGVRYDLIVVPRQDQGRNVEFLQVLGMIRLGERLDAEVRRRNARTHPLKPE